MHDSLEDFIRLTRNTKQETSCKQNDIALTAQKKKECNARAMKIVHLLIEGKFRKESFLACLKYINPEYYQDIVEERAITSLCGYCLCGNKIPIMPQKKYHISTKLNKVYDITERKNYCSNSCYNSSLHVKRQIDTTPLWLRNYNDHCKIELLQDLKSGLPGEEIDQGIVKLPQETTFTSVSVFTGVSLDELISAEIKAPTNKNKTNAKSNQSMDTISECNEEDTANEVSLSNSDKIPEILDKTEIKLGTKIEEEKKVITKPRSNNQPKRKIDILKQVKKCVSEWLTLETLIHIHGENRIKEVLNEKKLSDYFDSLKITELQTTQQIKYVDICKKLNLKELADDKFDRAVTDRALHPIPDYKELKKENQKLDVKVKSFYDGGLYEQNDENFSTSPASVTNAGSDIIVPSADTSIQRKKIFLTSVNKVLQSMVDMLRLNKSEIFSAVQSLLKTFNLQAHNIVFKPAEWNIIVVTLLHILSIRHKHIEVELNNGHCKKFINLLLQNLAGHETFMCDITEMVSDVEIFVENYITGTS